MDKKIIWGITGAIVVVVVGAAAGVLAVNSSYRNTHTLQVTQLKDDEHKEEVKLNGWKEEQGSWYFYKNNDKQKNWIEDENSWYYLGSDGKMRTGWIKDKDQWYYLNNDGTMATNVTIDGCYLNDEGIIEETPAPAKTTNETISNNSSKSTTISPDRAIELIRENDNVYINNKQNNISAELGYNVQLALDYYDEDSMEASRFNESCYGIALIIQGGDIEECTYLVGKHTGNVYILPHQGTYNYYQIKNNQVVKTFYYGNDWR